MRTDDPNLRTHQDVAADYERRYAGQHHAEMRMFGNPRQTLAEAIHRACRSRIPKKARCRAKTAFSSAASYSAG
jgi:hypothetical protein